MGDDAELGSGARRLKRLGDLQPPQEEENLDAPAAPNRTTRKRGRGRGNAAATAVAKGSSAATPAWPTGAGRGREPAFNRVDGGSGDKAMGVEEGASTTPVPKRVQKGDTIGEFICAVQQQLAPEFQEVKVDLELMEMFFSFSLLQQHSFYELIVNNCIFEGAYDT